MSFLGATSRTVCARTSAWYSVGIGEQVSVRTEKGTSQTPSNPLLCIGMECLR